MALPDEFAIPTRTVLLVEDETLVAMIAVDSLSELGYEVVEVATARAALEQARRDCARFDFAVIDMGLPDHPGDHLIAELRKIRPNLPVIVASGYGESEVRRRFEPGERFAFLNKPYERNSLRAAIDSLGLADPSREPTC
jgi:CheY-like chemotaxis protein